MKELATWKDSIGRKPLIIEGARQVGKTWLMKEFGAERYRRTLIVNFDQNDTNPHAAHLASIFNQDLNPTRIVTALQLEYDVSIDAESTLLVFDEIQELPRALTSLKYFNEDAPQYHILAAGSQMGIALHQGTSFPVGKVSFLKLQPLNFDEYLIATGRERFVELLGSSDWSTIATFRQTYLEALKEYYFIGGMPEVVAGFRENHDYHQARIHQLEIIEGYRNDYSKHAPALLNARIQDTLTSIPRHLGKENKKFVWGAIRSGARSRDFELAVQWIVDCAQAYRVANLQQPYVPIETYYDQSAFKLYLHDVGLLGAMCGIDPRSILEGNQIIREYRGTLTEQYVLQQLKYLAANDPFMVGPAYWTGERAEVDFVIQKSGLVIPLEVKSAWNLKSKSLFAYIDKYHPPQAIRVSSSDYRVRKELIEVPLFAILHLDNLLDEPLG
jgi:predicted AAA+ superfamily ATPase